MNIAIIGAGNVGGALTRGARKADHIVTISSGNAADAAALSKETGATAATSNLEAITAADIVILAVPYDAVAGIVSELGANVAGKIIIDVTNRFSPDELNGPSNAENIQAMVKGARVVKAFNTVFASNQASPNAHGVQLDGFVAGDDADAKRIVLELLESMGFRGIDVGPLTMARALEGMGTLNIALNMNNNWSWQTGWKLVGPTA
jgi:8-hydroxy-5-deazaflavin:NADPH oxidoreductase